MIRTGCGLKVMVGALAEDETGVGWMAGVWWMSLSVGLAGLATVAPSSLKWLRRLTQPTSCSPFLVPTWCVTGRAAGCRRAGCCTTAFQFPECSWITSSH